MLGLDVVASIAGFALPVVSDLVKSIFGTKSSPQATLGTLATTKPDVIPEYVKANAGIPMAQSNQQDMGIYQNVQQIHQ